MVEVGEEPTVDYNAANDAKNKVILQKLQDECEDAETKAIIRCYTIGAKGSDIRKDINKHKLDPVKKCAKYLGLYPTGDTKKVKPAIITDIIRRINSLLMDLCGICGDYFNTELHDKPLFRCLICHQGCHTKCFNPIDTMFRQLDATHRKAIQFICTSCHSDHNDDDEQDAEIIVNAPKVKKSPSKAVPATKVSESTPAPEDHSSKTNDDTRDPEPRSPGPGAPTSNIQVCPQYKWGRCPEFETCEFRHPPRCWSWLELGKCSYKGKCRYHHPPLCNNSINNRQCFDATCKYFHLKRTLRYRMEDEHLKDSLHAANYHAQNQPSPAAHHPDQSNISHAHQPRPPSHQTPRLPHPDELPQPPQQPPHHQPPHQSQNQHQPAAPQAHAQQNQNKLSTDDISFLVQTLKSSLREDLEKEVAKIKQMLNQPQQVPQIVQQLPNRHIIQQQLQTPPNLYNLQMIPPHQ